MESDKERCEKEQAKMEQVALSFQKAMIGIGTDENRIIREVLAYNNKQRQLIKSKYLVLTGNELTDDLKSEINGYFLEAVLGLFTPVDEYEATIIHNAITNPDTDETKIIEILCSKSAEEIRKLKSAYNRVYKSDLESNMKNEKSGDLGRLFRSLVSGGRNENHGYDKEFIEKQTQDLYDAGEGKTGTEEQQFIKILSTRSFAELNAIFALYKENFERELEDVIKEEFSGHLCEALIAIVKSVRSRPGYFADLISRSLQGKKTFERDLLQVLIRRADIDLPEILAEFKKLQGRSLSDVVQKETKDEFQKLMLGFLKKY